MARNIPHCKASARSNALLSLGWSWRRTANVGVRRKLRHELGSVFPCSREKKDNVSY